MRPTTLHSLSLSLPRMCPLHHSHVLSHTYIVRDIDAKMVYRPAIDLLLAPLAVEHRNDGFHWRLRLLRLALVLLRDGVD